MGRKPRILVFVFVILCIVGCAKKAMVTPPVIIKSGSRTVEALSTFRTYAGAPQRYVAESHKLEIISPESQLASAWQSVVSFCGTFQCEILNSSVTNRTRDAVPSGTIALRVVPDELSKLFGFVEKRGVMAQLAADLTRWRSR